MTTFPFLTVHTLVALPWHNLNRDENGAPKQVTEGGVTRARLSSQSLKRAARVAFERDMEQAEESVRTKRAADIVVERIEQLRGPLTKPQRTAMAKSVATRVASLTQAEDGTGKKDTLVWLSAREIEQVAQAFAAGEDSPLLSSSSTDSLAIAAFGRMFTAQPDLNIASAVAVGDAVTTHAASIELDWYSAVDDRATHNGAGQLGFTMQTTGVYYRSFTFDRRQLADNWDVPLNAPEAEPQLRSLVRHLTLALPTGRNAGTAAQTLPAFVFAEEQSHRVAYDFHTPLRAGDSGGYLEESIAALQAKAAAAREFDPTLFGANVTCGTHPGAGSFADSTSFVLGFLRG